MNKDDMLESILHRGEEHMKYKNIETVKRLDFDHLDMLVSERIGALKLLAQGMTEREVNDDICRDLILPCVYALAQFIESVQIEGKNNG
jgi:hypothetical protein